MHGQGVFKWPDGTIYEGSYHKNIKQGKGRIVYMDFKQLIGEWVNGKLHGQVLYVKPNGQTKDVIYHHGKKIKILEDSILLPIK